MLMLLNFIHCKTTYNANIAWNNQVENYGHYTSIAMGTIYPLLQKYTYLISNKYISTDKGIDELIKR